MRDSLYIGECPADESCAQVGSDDYYEKARKECLVFIRQLRREFGEEPGSARLKIKSNPHDFGTYLSVECIYDDNDEEAMNYAFKLEAETPENWDEEAKKELGIK